MEAPISSHDWPNPLPDVLARDLRSDHAGEVGAVMIYRGILAVSRDPEVRRFAEHHLETERAHLRSMEALVPESGRTRLLWLWRIMGWLTGALPALFGSSAVYATIQAVETFVDRHYGDQIERLQGVAAWAQVRQILVSCQEDEIAHRDEAAALAGQQLSLPLQIWTRCVSLGSQGAVVIAKKV